MDEVRKGQIALAVLRNIARKRGITVNPSQSKRELGNLSKETSIPIDELLTFYREEIRLLIDLL
jgi:hypothetical protein